MAATSRPRKKADAVARAPSPALLREQLGAAHSHWESLIARAFSLDPNLTADWKCYPPGKTWVYVARNKKRNVLYMRPGEKVFMASTALSEPAVAAIRASDLPASVIEEIAGATRYPEGRPFRIAVRTAAHAKTMARVLEFKLGAT